MSRSLLRLLHASDLQLHRSLSGFTEVSDELREVLTDAPIAAARGVFDAAIANAVDALILSGNVVRADCASPRALRFLVDQFQRLAEKGIPIYWAGGPYDGPQQWPAAVTLPSNVHHFASDKVESTTYSRDEQPVAVIAGRSNAKERINAGDYKPGRDGLFTIAVACGEAKREELTNRAIHYWALGGVEAGGSPDSRGSSDRSGDLSHGMHYPGSPQGFTSADTGKHGATLVNIEEGGAVRLQSISTDIVRWHNEQVSAVTCTSDEEIYQLLSERAKQLAAASPDRHLLVRWSLLVGDSMRRALTSEGMAKDLTKRLRKTLGARKPAVWTCRLAALAREEVPAELYEEDTILGDFLRSLREYRTSDRKHLDLDSQLTGDFGDSPAVAAIRAADDGARERLLRDAAALGVDMLGGASLAESGGAMINFGGDDRSKAMTLKHDGEVWQTQQDLAAMLDEEPTP